MKKSVNPEGSTTTVRLPPALHAEIKSAAEYHGRSMNSEIIDRLTSAATGATLNTIAQQNVELKAMVQRLIDALGPRK